MTDHSAEFRDIDQFFWTFRVGHEIVALRNVMIGTNTITGMARGVLNFDAVI
jgi:hypothetical protein